MSIDGPAIKATSVYTLDGRVWRQPWTLYERTDDELVRALQTAGLEPIELDGPWVVARPCQSRDDETE